MGKKGKGKGPSVDDLLKQECRTWSIHFREAPPKEKADAKNSRQTLVKKDIECKFPSALFPSSPPLLHVAPDVPSRRAIIIPGSLPG
jgi:hypothetical protein